MLNPISKTIKDAAQYTRLAADFSRAGRHTDARYWQSMADVLVENMDTADMAQVACLAAQGTDNQERAKC